MEGEAGQDRHAWHPRTILIPRIGMLVTRFGTRTSLILPGYYLVRRSRTLRRTMYRRRP